MLSLENLITFLCRSVNQSWLKVYFKLKGKLPVINTKGCHLVPILIKAKCTISGYLGCYWLNHTCLIVLSHGTKTKEIRFSDIIFNVIKISNHQKFIGTWWQFYTWILLYSIVLALVCCGDIKHNSWGLMMCSRGAHLYYSKRVYVFMVHCL